MVCVIQVCWQLASKNRMELQFHSDPARKPSANLYDTYHCCLYSDDGQGNCPKYVKLHSKNKFEKFVHLVGFIIRNILNNFLSDINYVWSSIRNGMQAHMIKVHLLIQLNPLQAEAFGIGSTSQKWPRFFNGTQGLLPRYQSSPREPAIKKDEFGA